MCNWARLIAVHEGELYEGKWPDGDHYNEQR